MNLMLQVSAHFREIGVFGQQAIAGVDGVDIGNFGRTDHGRNIQVAVDES